MSDKRLIFYFGDDEAYFKAFQVELKKHFGELFAFKRYFANNPSQIQSLYHRVYEEHPILVLVDYSKFPNDYLRLARLLVRTNSSFSYEVIGLLDYQSTPQVVKESALTGTKLTHIKGAEIFDVVYGSMRLAKPKETKDHGFATAKTKDDVEVGIPCKISFVNEDSVHFETDLKLEQDEVVSLTNFWTDQKIMRSDKIAIKKVTSSDIYNNAHFAVDGSFFFLNRPDPVTDEFLYELNKTKKKFKGWITDNMSRSASKNVKILVIDRDLGMTLDQAPTDTYPYLMRSQPFLRDIQSELDKTRPNVIALVLEGRPEDAPPTLFFNDSSVLKQIVHVVTKKLTNYSPFIVIFKSATSNSKELQQVYSYENILASTGELSIDFLLKMAEAFAKRVEIPSETLFFKKNNPAVYAEIKSNVVIRGLSENDMIFKCDRPLDPYTSLHFKFPVDMFVTIIPSDKVKGENYYGLIHMAGETEKQELRRHVNAVFFRDLENQKKAEKAEFERLNQKKLKEIQDELAKKQSAEATEKAAKAPSPKPKE